MKAGTARGADQSAPGPQDQEVDHWLLRCLLCLSGEWAQNRVDLGVARVVEVPELGLTEVKGGMSVLVAEVRVSAVV